MRAFALAFVLAPVAACNPIFGLDPPTHSDAAGGRDAADADLGGGWSTAVPIAAAATMLVEDDPALSPDGHELLFSALAPDEKIMSALALGSGGWSNPAPALGLDSPTNDGGARLFTRGDFQWIYFASDRGGNLDIWVSTRSGGVTQWLAPAYVDALSSAGDENAAAPCKERTRFVVSSGRVGPSEDLFEIDDTGRVDPITIANTATDETGPFLTEDCLTLYYASHLAGNFDIYVIHRDEVGKPWSEPALVDVSTTQYDEGDPWVSDDGHHLLFATNRAGNYDIYEAFR